MKRKSPISIDRIQFCAYKCYETEDLVFIDQFFYEDRHDFLVDKFLGGIAIKLKISNKRYDKGARRNVSLSLVDMTARCDVATQQIKVCLAIDGFKDCYAYFPAETSGLVGGHTYKLLVCDETASETLTERIFHLFDKSTMKNPTEWYEICDGGIRPAWKTDLLKSLNTVDSHDYYVQFNLAPNTRWAAWRTTTTIAGQLNVRLRQAPTSMAFFMQSFSAWDILLPALCLTQCLLRISAANGMGMKFSRLMSILLRQNCLMSLSSDTSLRNITH